LQRLVLSLDGRGRRRRQCLPAQSDPSRIFELIKQHGVTHMCGAPIVYNTLINAPDAPKGKTRGGGRTDRGRGPAGRRARGRRAHRHQAYACPTD